MQLHHQIQNEQFSPTPPTIAPKSAKAKGTQRENAAQGQREQALQELAEPLNSTNGLPSYAEAIDLLTNRILQENHENRPSSNLDYDRMWSFASDQPAQSKKKRFFSRGQRPTNQKSPSDVSLGKRKRATDPPPNRTPIQTPTTPPLPLFHPPAPVKPRPHRTAALQFPLLHPRTRPRQPHAARNARIRRLETRRGVGERAGRKGEAMARRGRVSVCGDGVSGGGGRGQGREGFGCWWVGFLEF